MKRWKRQVGLVCLVTVLHLLVSMVPMVEPWGGRSLIPPANAQASERQAIASSVYELLPDFPRENDYVHTETGEVAVDNTLVYRMLLYHRSVQSRPLASRFDWKLTLADYLGVNEWMDEERYPDRFLQANPFHRDIEIIRSLDRQQREELIQALLIALTP